MRSAPSTSRPTISIVTVCFNESRQAVRATFQSVVEQTWEPLEWVVIDGGSQPETLEAIREFATHIDVLVSEPDEGIFDAMNKGVRVSSGELLLFMNVGDRFADGNAVARLATAAVDEPNNGFYFGDWVCVDKDGTRRLIRSRRFGRFELFVDTICHQAVLNRRVVFDEVGSFDSRFDPGAEQEWYMRAVDARYTGLYVSGAVCDYQKEGDHNRNLGRLYRARRARRIRHYSRLDRMVFGIFSVVVKTADRVRARDFSVPVRLRQLGGRVPRRGSPVR